MPSENAFTHQLEKLSVVVTWAIVTTTMLYFMAKQANIETWQVILLAFCCFGYLYLWLKTSAGIEGKAHESRKRQLMALMFINIIVIYLLAPYNYTAIFMMMWCALTPYFVRVNTALLISPLWSLPFWLIYRWYWGEEYAIVTTGLFWTFNLFAIIMVNATIKEKQARENAEQMNIALKSSHQLLHQAAKQAERTRIARNIHDLLGHHLTALTINLQVASKKLALNEENKTEVKKNIDQCHSLAKLLLSDVREAVSDIRDKSRIDLSATLSAITEGIQPIAISLNVDETASFEDFSLAESIVRVVQESITNTLKHSNANKMSINIQRHQHKLAINIIDNGKCNKNWHEGNGLTGIRERIDLLKGITDIKSTSTGFSVAVQIPLDSHD